MEDIGYPLVAMGLVGNIYLESFQRLSLHYTPQSKSIEEPYKVTPLVPTYSPYSYNPFLDGQKKSN